MNMKKTLAFTFASAVFAFAQAPATPAAAPAQPAQPAEQAAPAQPAAEPAQQAAPAAPVAEASKPAEAPAQEAAAPAAQPAAEAPAEAAAEPAAQEPVAPNALAVLHGNSYNTVGNQAASDNVNGLLNQHLTKLAGKRFFYIEPANEFGMFSLGNFFGAMDISGEVGRATAGYATQGFAAEIRLALGQFATEGDNGNKSGSSAGDDWGFTVSKILAGYELTVAGDWITYADQENAEPKVGSATEQRFRDMTASVAFSNAPSASKHFWTGGLSFTRHENVTEVAGEAVNEDVEESISIVPTFNYGMPALRTEYANLYLGVNTTVPVTLYDDQDVYDSLSMDDVTTSKFGFGLAVTPNIPGEVRVTEGLMFYGEASYTWNVIQLVSGTDVTGDEYTTKVSKADEVKATAGLRYQYKDWAACEFAFGDSFFTDTKSIFNGEGVFVSFGAFIFF